MYQSQRVRVHCRGPRVEVPKVKVSVWRFSDVGRGRKVEVQMSKSVVSISHNSRVKICHRVPGSECESSLSWIKGESSEDQSQWVEVLWRRSRSNSGGSLSWVRGDSTVVQSPTVKVRRRRSESRGEDSPT